jgi:prevent-host-death family protein
MSKHKPVATITSTTLQREVGIVTRRVYADKEHIIVERDGLPVVAIIPADEYRMLTENNQIKK